MPDEKIKMTVSVPVYHYKLLKLWAYFKGRGAAMMTSDIVQARVEANLAEIDLMLKSRAKDLNLSSEELIDKIINNQLDD